MGHESGAHEASRSAINFGNAEGWVVPFLSSSSAVDVCLFTNRRRVASGVAGGPGGSPMGPRTRPRDEKFLTLFSKAGSNLVQSAAIRMEFVAAPRRSADPSARYRAQGRPRGPVPQGNPLRTWARGDARTWFLATDESQGSGQNISGGRIGRVAGRGGFRSPPVSSVRRQGRSRPRFLPEFAQE